MPAKLPPMRFTICKKAPRQKPSGLINTYMQPVVNNMKRSQVVLKPANQNIIAPKKITKPVTLPPIGTHSLNKRLGIENTHSSIDSLKPAQIYALISPKSKGRKIHDPRNSGSGMKAKFYL